MKNIKFKVILCFIILTSNVSAQTDKLKIVVLRGAAIIENPGSRIELEKSNRITLQKNAKVKLLPNSNIIAYNNKHLLCIKAAKHFLLACTCGDFLYSRYS